MICNHVTVGIPFNLFCYIIALVAMLGLCAVFYISKDLCYCYGRGHPRLGTIGPGVQKTRHFSQVFTGSTYEGR